MRKPVVVLAIFGMAAVLVWWLSMETDELLYTAEQPERQAADYFLENYVMTVMGDDGKPRYRLYADDMYHYPDNDTAMLKKPHMLWFMGQDVLWDIRAERALALQRQDEIQMQGHVLMQRRINGNERDMEIVSSDVDVYTGKEYLETAREVTIDHQAGHTEAIGMRAELSQRRLFLLSRVRGQYDAPAE